MSREELNKPRDDLFCEFCGKKCKNLNSLKQHSIRCPNNPNRKDFNRLGAYSTSLKGKTKYDDNRIKRSSETLKLKYAQGYQSPLKGITRFVQHIYKEHNDAQILKWQQYIENNTFEISELETTLHTEGYKVLSRHQTQKDNTVQIVFEHDYIANILLCGNLKSTNTVHHIDENKANNLPVNLMVFVDNTNHKRFHNSNYAKLTYDEHTHLFSCDIVKMK